ncbi:MAG: DUF4350 domain-containing protein [Bacteroidota bacterium]
MPTNTKNSIVGIGIALLLLLVGYLLWQQSPRYNWKESYQYDTKDPYGTQVVRQLLEAYFPTQTLVVVEEDLAQQLSSAARANYVFVGDGMYMDSSATKAVLDFVERGNQAFISTKIVVPDLLDVAADSFCNGLRWQGFDQTIDTSINLNFLHPSLQLDEAVTCKFKQPKQTTPLHGWNYFSETYFCDDSWSFAALGYFQDSLINFARLPYGHGYIYLHSTPLAFTNIHLLEKEGATYAYQAFSHLVEGTIYWDTQSAVSEQLAKRLNQPSTPSHRGLSSESPLQYVLSQPPLAVAWYLSILLAGLYIWFRAKRRQRIIPVLERNENTSLAFVQNIGQLYFLQNNHRTLALQKMRLFLMTVRERYHLSSSTFDVQFMQRLHERSDIPLADIEQLFTMYRNIESSRAISENTLIRFHQLLELFE